MLNAAVLGAKVLKVQRSGRIIVPVFAALAIAANASAQQLTIQGDRFAVDGKPRFLVFVSYFGAMGAADIVSDFAFLRNQGFDGVRIWPNSPDGPQLMNGDGTLRDDALSRLKFILDRARDQRLIVDVSFTAEHIRGMDAQRYRAGIEAATEALRAYDGVLFDIENERNIYGPFGRSLAAEDVAAILAAIKRVHSGRIVTASNSPEVSADFTADFTSALGLDVTAYHDPRVSNWYRPEQINAVVSALRRSGRPVYLQEPTRVPFASTDSADYFRQALANAKAAGAAAWCFHTDLGFNLTGTRFEDRLRSRQNSEWEFVMSLTPRVNLRASNGSNYLVADGGGGGVVRADRISPGPWETFTLVVVDGGLAVAGDRIALRSSNGSYLQAAAGGGAGLQATGTAIGPWETFVVEKAGGGAVNHGDSVRLKTDNGPWYVVAENGGGAEVHVNRTAPASWETFTVLFVR